MPSARGLVHDNDAEQGVPGAQLMWSACCALKQSGAFASLTS